MWRGERAYEKPRSIQYISFHRRAWDDCFGSFFFEPQSDHAEICSLSMRTFFVF